MCENTEFFENSKEVINLKNIVIEIPDSRSWYLNLISASTSRAEFIRDNYKKKFRAFVIINDNDLICKFPAKVRLSGDGKDHIEINNSNITASLDVELLKGNIN